MADKWFTPPDGGSPFPVRVSGDVDQADVAGLGAELSAAEAAALVVSLMADAPPPPRGRPVVGVDDVLAGYGLEKPAPTRGATARGSSGKAKRKRRKQQ